MSVRVAFHDVDDFADALCGVDGRFIPTARPTSQWWMETQVLSQSCLQQYQIGGAATFAGEGQSNVLMCAVPMTDPTQMRIDGHCLEPDAFLAVQKDRSFTYAGQDVVRWTAVSLAANTTYIAADLLAPLRSGDSPLLRSELSYLDRLRRVVQRATSVQIDSLDFAAAQAMEEEVAICLSHVLERSVKELAPPLGRPQFCRSRIIARTLALIEANEGQMIFVDDLCRATQVSERSLRNIFHDFFGVGPMRLLKLRQLREIRAALLRADPQRDTVTRIAARFGVWDFCLFARNYKALFGESPSRTLRTPPSDVKAGSSLGWLHYASRIFIDDVAPAQPANEAALSSPVRTSAEAREPPTRRLRVAS